jgi:hypothetical protein
VKKKTTNRRETMKTFKGKFGNGDTVRDTITGFEGVVIGVRVTFWLNGCRRYGIQPREMKDGKPIDSAWFDEEQLELVSEAEPKDAKPSGGPMPDPVGPVG